MEFFINSVIITLIYVSVIESQHFPNRGNDMPFDDLVAAIATAAMNGVIPLHKMNLGNPNRKGDAPLRIPILLIRPNDLRSLRNGKKFSNDRTFWGNTNRRGPRNGRDYYKKDYSPKPKYPTQGMKVIPAPKNFELEKEAIKKNFEKKPVMNQMNNRFNGRDRDIEEYADRYVDSHNNNKPMNQFKLRMNEERNNRNRLNKYNPIDEEIQNERLPLRQSDRWQDNKPNTYELPEKEPVRQLNYEDYDYDRGQEEKPLPSLKPVMKVPTIVRHVYGANAPTDNEKPTIPPRYLKTMSDIPSPSDSNRETYDNTQNEPRPYLTKIPSLREMLPPLPDEGSQSYNTQPLVTHKYVNMGDVYRKGNNEQHEDDLDSQDDQGEQGDQGEGVLAGYGKDPYDKQLISTLTKLMATSKNRHPLNIGGLTGAEEKAKPTAKPVLKVPKYTTLSGGQTSSAKDKPSIFDEMFGPVKQSSTIFKSPSMGSYNQQQLTPQSQYFSSSPSSSQTQSSSQSRIPESLLSSFSPLNSKGGSSGSQGSVMNDNLSTGDSKRLVPLKPSQVPVVPSVTRKPVFLPLDYNTGDRPLSADSLFDDAVDDYAPAKSAQA